MVRITPRASENDYGVQGLHILARIITRSLMARRLDTKSEQQSGKTKKSQLEKGSNLENGYHPIKERERRT